MADLLYLSLCYIRYHRNKLAILVLAITLASWLPLAIQIIVDETAAELLDRADKTPLVIGAPGSSLELALGSLYFQTQPREAMAYGEVSQVEATGHAGAIPLYYRFNAQGNPIVGTTPAYFDFRELVIAEGRHALILGEAVLGADVARRLSLSIGDHVISSPENVFDIAGVYPLKMKVTGILAPSFSPDDGAVFVDIKTSWVINGLGHGHDDLNTVEAAGQVLKNEGGNLVANASVRQFNEITPGNVDSFHFHGETSGHPVSAILPVPLDRKSQALLLGLYQEERSDLQIVRSSRVIEELLDTVFTVRDYIVVGIAAVGLATAVIALLVFLLSLQLRREERHTLTRIGASGFQVNLLMATEIISVLVVSALLSIVLISVTRVFGMQLLQQFLIT